MFKRMCLWRTGDALGSNAGDGGCADVLCQRRLVTFLQQVPHLDTSVLFPNEEDGRPRRRPVTYSIHDLRAARLEDRSVLKQNRWKFKLTTNTCVICIITASQHNIMLNYGYDSQTSAFWKRLLNIFKGMLRCRWTQEQSQHIVQMEKWVNIFTGYSNTEDYLQQCVVFNINLTSDSQRHEETQLCWRFYYGYGCHIV